jgi:hypothetical protein
VIISYEYNSQLGTGGNSIYSTATGLTTNTNWVHVFTTSGFYIA